MSCFISTLVTTKSSNGIKMLFVFWSIVISALVQAHCGWHILGHRCASKLLITNLPVTVWFSRGSVYFQILWYFCFNLLQAQSAHSSSRSARPLSSRRHVMLKSLPFVGYIDLSLPLICPLFRSFSRFRWLARMSHFLRHPTSCCYGDLRYRLQAT